MTTDLDYTLFHQFLESYTGQGFLNINSSDELMIALEQLMEKNNQFFYIADIIQMKVLYTSKRSKEMIGIEPQEVSPYFFYGGNTSQRHSKTQLG